MFLIGLPEKARVVETCPQHAFVAAANQALRIAVGVQYRQEMRQQFAVRPLEREIFLVIAHHRD